MCLEVKYSNDPQCMYRVKLVLKRVFFSLSHYYCIIRSACKEKIYREKIRHWQHLISLLYELELRKMLIFRH
jgi:hypothetical protein